MEVERFVANFEHDYMIPASRVCIKWPIHRGDVRFPHIRELMCFITRAALGLKESKAVVLNVRWKMLKCFQYFKEGILHLP